MKGKIGNGRRNEETEVGKLVAEMGNGDGAGRMGAIFLLRGIFLKAEFSER